VVKCLGNELRCRLGEIVLEGVIHPGETALEGLTATNGYYNEQETFPVFTVERITMRRDPIYHSTYTGKPPDEPAISAWRSTSVRALVAEAVPEITDFYLPPKAAPTAWRW